MTLLIVDDQISVVSSLYFGIDWQHMGIGRVLKAYSAKEAKDLFETQQIDIMLCDIEMPVEDGLSLLSWVRMKGYGTECIFLTAHADFIYAKEAIALQCFDYILQPARYEDIQKTVARLMDQIAEKRKNEEMMHCGDLMKDRKGIFLDAVASRLLFERGEQQMQARQDLNKLGIRPRDKDNAYAAILVLHDADEAFKTWDNDLIRYAMDNVLEEIFHMYGYGALLCSRTRREYALYIYSREAERVERDLTAAQLKRFREFYQKYYHCSVSCYFAVCRGLQDTADTFEKLEELCRNDVVREACVVDGDAVMSSLHQPEGYERIHQYFAQIGPLLENGLYGKISDDLTEMLDHLSEEKMLDAAMLRRFYQDFMSIAYRAAEMHQKTLSELFDEEQDRERSLNAFASVNEMKWLVKYIMAWLNERSMSGEKQKSQIDRICQYIRSNMEQDIKRTDIAELVHLNPNYVSRLFKNEMGVSLKEYIMQTKMKLAKELVRETNLPISVITMKVGYNNFSYFAQVYKKVNGLSPAEDREINGKNQ